MGFSEKNIIRGPICRLLGLQNVLKVTDSPNEVLKISKLMAALVEELNTITLAAARLLEQTIPEQDEC